MKESTKKTIYAVTTGEYSDYRLLGVFSTKAKAENFKALTKSDYIEEYELNGMMDHPKGMLWWEVSMDAEGNSREVTHENAIYSDSYKDSDWRPDGDGSNVSFYLWARNEKHAVKVANERRLALIASGQWTADWHAWKASQLQPQAPAV